MNCAESCLSNELITASFWNNKAKEPKTPKPWPPATPHCPGPGHFFRWGKMSSAHRWPWASDLRPCPGLKVHAEHAAAWYHGKSNLRWLVKDNLNPPSWLLGQRRRHLTRRNIQERQTSTYCRYKMLQEACNLGTPAWLRAVNGVGVCEESSSTLCINHLS